MESKERKLLEEAAKQGKVALEVCGNNYGDLVSAFADDTGVRLCAVCYIVEKGMMKPVDDLVFVMETEVVEMGVRTADGRVSAVKMIVSDVLKVLDDEGDGAKIDELFDFPIMPVGARVAMMYDRFRDVGCVCKIESAEGKYTLAQTPGFEGLDVDGKAVGTIRCGDSLRSVLKALTGLVGDDADDGAGSGDSGSGKAGADDKGKAAAGGSGFGSDDD